MIIKNSVELTDKNGVKAMNTASDRQLYVCMRRINDDSPPYLTYITAWSWPEVIFLSKPADYPKRISEWSSKGANWGPVLYAGFPSKWVRLKPEDTLNTLERYLPKDCPPNWAVPIVRGSTLKRWRHHRRHLDYQKLG